MSTASPACVCAHLATIKLHWNNLTRQERSDVARDVDIVTQEPPRRDVYSVSSTHSLSSVALIERVESKWELVPADVRESLRLRCESAVARRNLRNIRNARRGKLR